jgi:hypothetical protein
MKDREKRLYWFLDPTKVVGYGGTKGMASSSRLLFNL